MKIRMKIRKMALKTPLSPPLRSAWSTTKLRYGCVRAYATKLGDVDAASLLSQTLEDEKEADETLNGVADSTSKFRRNRYERKSER